MSDYVSLQDEDFIIRVRPSVAGGGMWTGEVDIAIIAQPDNPLDDEGYSQLMHFCKMICSTVPIMEQDETIRNLVHTYVMEVVDNEEGFDVELEQELGVEKEYDGNVVHLTFNSKTGGSA